MKKIFFLSMLLAGASFFTACSDDDDNYLKQLPPQVEQSFSQKFPDIKGARWENDHGMFKSEFRNAQGVETEVWFAPDGSWIRTETDVHPAALPEAVKQYVTTAHVGYYVDDAEYIETPQAAYFHLELEAKGKPDVEVNVFADGTLVEGILPDGVIGENSLPAAVLAAFVEKYPNLHVKEWEVERGLIKAEFLMPDGTETEAYFDMKGSWVRTEFDFKGSLPEAVMSYIVSNYPDYKVDDANYVQTPLGDYYELELEKNGRPVVYLNICEDATLWK